MNPEDLKKISGRPERRRRVRSPSRPAEFDLSLRRGPQAMQGGAALPSASSGGAASSSVRPARDPQPSHAAGRQQCGGQPGSQQRVGRGRAHPGERSAHPVPPRRPKRPARRSRPPSSAPSMPAPAPTPRLRQGGRHGQRRAGAVHHRGHEADERDRGRNRRRGPRDSGQERRAGGIRADAVLDRVRRGDEAKPASSPHHASGTSHHASPWRSLKEPLCSRKYSSPTGARSP